jgi:hypothetical protein
MASYAYTFTSGDTITPTKLNNARTVSAIQTADISNLQITEGLLAANSVSTTKIADANVTNAKLASDIDASKLTTGTLPIARIADDAVTNDKLSLAANAGEIKKALNADNDPPIYACRAWVNFNGTRNATDTGASTNGANVFIRNSGNVASVLKNGTGDYTITFTTDMPDENYCVTSSGEAASGGYSIIQVRSGTAPTASSVRILSSSQVTNTPAVTDFARVCVAIFR